MLVWKEVNEQTTTDGKLSFGLQTESSSHNENPPRGANKSEMPFHESLLESPYS